MRRLLFPLLAVIPLVIAGCDSGPSYHSVKGRASFNGVPIERGLVQFEAVAGNVPSAKGGAIVNGEYTAEVPAGDYAIKVVGFKVIGKQKAYDTPDSKEMELTQQFIPDQFNTATTLKATIKGSRTDLDFILKSE